MCIFAVMLQDSKYDASAVNVLRFVLRMGSCLHRKAGRPGDAESTGPGSSTGTT